VLVVPGLVVASGCLFALFNRNLRRRDSQVLVRIPISTYTVEVGVLTLIQNQKMIINISSGLITWGIIFPLVTIIPGYLLLSLLHNTDKTQIWTNFVISVGLGLIILSLIGFTFKFAPFSYGITVASLLAATWYTNSLPSIPTVPNITLQCLLPGLLPLIAIASIWLLNTTGSNLLVVLFLVLIPIYVVALYIRAPTNVAIFPISILAIGVSLALLYGIRHSNIPNGDISFEYFVFIRTVEAGAWDLSLYPTPYTKRIGSLWSVTVLPTAYYYILGETQGIYLIGYRLLAGLLPLSGYIVFQHFISDRNAFIASFFIAAQIGFMTLIGSMARVEIAFLFFYLLVAIFLIPGFTRRSRILLLGIFTVGTVFAHYTTALLGLAVFGGYFVLTLVSERTNVPSLPYKQITLGLVCGFFLAQVFFYGILTDQILGTFFTEFQVLFIEFSQFAASTVVNYYDSLLNTLTSIFEPSQSSSAGATEPPSGSSETGNTGTGSETGSDEAASSGSDAGQKKGGQPTLIQDTFPYRVTFLIYALSSGLIALGSMLTVGDTLLQWTERDHPLDFTAMVVSTTGLFGVGIVGLLAYEMYDPHRLLLQFSIILAPMPVIAFTRLGELLPTVSSWARDHRSQLQTLIVVLIVGSVALQYVAGTYLVFQLAGASHGEFFNNDGERYNKYYVTDSDVAVAEWINSQTDDEDVWGDFYTENIYARYDPDDARQGIGMPWFSTNMTKNDYVMLRCYNTKTGMFDPGYKQPVRMEKTGVLHNKSLVYQQGCAKVYA
jgi:uncharacterized membrane protein